MPTTAQNKKNEQGINVLDLLSYLLSKWKWYALSLSICCGYTIYKYNKDPLVYYRTATILIKDPSNKNVQGGLDRFDNIINKVNLSNELLQFRSKNLMREVVMRLHTDVDYQIKKRFRMEELYHYSPVTVDFCNVMPERYISFDLTIQSQGKAKLENIAGINGAKNTYLVGINDSIVFDTETIKIFPSDQMDKSWIGRTIRVTKSPVSAKVGYFLGNFSVRQESGGSSMLQLSMTDGIGIRAEDMLNTIITVYNEQALNDKNQISVNSSIFINERLKIIEAELGGVEDELLEYKRRNNIVNISTTTNQYLNKYSSLSDDIVEYETQLKVAQFMKQYLADPTKSSELIPANSGIDDGEIEKQISQYNTLKLKRDHLIVDSSSRNPVVNELNKSMRDLRQSIIRAIDNKMVSINMKRQDAIREQNYAEQRVFDMPAKERGMLSIERQQSIKESLYLYLLNKREENALAQAMAENNARVIDSAQGGSMPISPERNKLMLLGILLGLTIPSVVFLFIMFLDTKIHSRKDLHGKTNIPFLGEVPFDEEHKKRSKKHGGILQRLAQDSDENDNGMTREAFKILRTNMAFMGRKITGKSITITFTSFNEGAGKTFIASNLGLSLADSKKKVIMVDLDIRKRSLSHLFSHQRNIGVTNYLADESIQLGDIIHHSDVHDNLDIIYGGHAAPNPAELLMDNRLDTMIEELKKRYDYIIADNVPVGIVADATISNRISDLTLFVVRSGKLDRRQIPDLESLYSEGKLRNMAIVLNGVDPKYRGYGYRYGYGYGYGYGYRYGYGYGEKKKKKKNPILKILGL